MTSSYRTRQNENDTNTMPHAERVMDTKDADDTALIGKLTIPVGMMLAKAVDNPWDPHETPQWFWTLVDLGNNLQRRGLPEDALARKVEQAIRNRGDQRYYDGIEDVKNHLFRAWQIEAMHLARRDRRAPDSQHRLQQEELLLVEQVEETFFAIWLREYRRQFEPWHEDSTDAEASSSCSDTTHCTRSRSPSAAPPRVQDNEGTGDSTSLMDTTRANIPARKKSPTRLWKELPPERKSSEVRKLTPPWKKGNNPPLKPQGPREPSRSPPKAPPRAKPRPRPRAAEVAEPTTPPQVCQESEAIANTSTGPLDYNEAIATWQALFEMAPNEGIAEEDTPVLPQHLADNIVETLVDKPPGDHNIMVDTFPSFLGRLQQDVSRTLTRARELRERLEGSGSSTDKPQEGDHEPDQKESEESIYMQTTLDFGKLSPQKDTMMGRLQAAFNKMDIRVASSRAIQLAARLQEHDGEMAVDRAELEALLISFSVDTPPESTDEQAIVEGYWVETWWRRITGQTKPNEEEIDKNLREYEEAVDRQRALQEAEQAHQDAAEQMYLRGLEEAVAHHQEQLKAEECRAEDERTMQQALGFTWELPKKAWDWELDRGAEVQIHIKATKTEDPGVWRHNGKIIPEANLPDSLKAASSRQKAQQVDPKPYDLRRPATQELYKRWCRGEVSDQSVVTASSTGMLSYFMAMRDIPDEVWKALDEQDTMAMANPESILNNAEADAGDQLGKASNDGDSEGVDPMALVRTGFGPDRTATRRSGGVTGAVDRALPFPHHTALESTTLEHGRITIYNGILPQDAAAFAEWNGTGIYTLRVDHATTPGGPWGAAQCTTDAFVAAHGSLDPATHAQAAIAANYLVLEYDTIHEVLGAPAWTPSAAAQAQLVAAGWTGVAGPVNICSPARNTPGRLTIGSHKWVVTSNLATVTSLAEAYTSYLTALTAGNANATIDGVVVAVRAAPATVGASFDQAMTAAGVNVRSVTGAAAPTQNPATGHGVGWFIASEWTDNLGNDGINVDSLWVSATVTEFQLATAGERPVVPAAGAAAAVEPFAMAIDSILGQLAYGTGHDSSAEVWVFQLPGGAGPFVQPPNSGNVSITAAGLGAGGLTAASRDAMRQLLDCDLMPRSHGKEKHLDQIINLDYLNIPRETMDTKMPETRTKDKEMAANETYYNMERYLDQIINLDYLDFPRETMDIKMPETLTKDKEKAGNETYYKMTIRGHLESTTRGTDHPMTSSYRTRQNENDTNTMPHAERVMDTKDADDTALIGKLTIPVGMMLAKAVDNPWDPHETPQWFWTLVDLGNNLQRRGLPEDALARKVEQAIRNRGDQRYYDGIEDVKNHLFRAWQIEAMHLARRHRRAPDSQHRLQQEELLLVEQVEETFFAIWLREYRRQFEPWHEDSTDAEASSSCSDTTHCTRSRSPSAAPPRVQDNEGTGDSTSLMDTTRANIPARKKSPTRLWKELPPERKSSEVRKLTPPWKKGNNPPLKPQGPREPSRSPPKAPPRAKPRPRPRAAEVAEPTTPPQVCQESEAIANTSTGPLDYNEAIATWQALFEMAPNEGIAEEDTPVLPQHLADNIVETLVDKPPGDHNIMVDTFPSFLGRLQQDVSRTLTRARELRERLEGSGSSTDKPQEGDHEPDQKESEESIYMQTTLDFGKLSPQKDTMMGRLQAAFNKMDIRVASSRAIQLAARLQEHDGEMAVDRAELEALLISFSVDTPPESTDEQAIVEGYWVETWWRRITGQTKPNEEEIDKNLREYEEAVDRQRALQEAEQAHQDAAEQMYLRGLEEAVAHHQEQLKAEECRAEDERTMQQALGFTWEPPKKRLCLGVCVTDGTTTRAWDWELDRGAEVQIHIKATKTEDPGVWRHNGKIIPEANLPDSLKAASSRQKAQQVDPKPYDLRRPATQELYKRWCRGEVSDQSVVTASSTGMLSYFMAMRDIPDEVWKALDEQDTMAMANPESILNNAEADAGDQLGKASNDGDSEGTTQLLPGPEPPAVCPTTVSEELSQPAQSGGQVEEVGHTHATAEDDTLSNTDSYYNGRVWAERYGHPSEDRDVSDSSD
ncbi:unnamed protein product [Symbiodinium sp. CCMP2592]|nr:unnamed protein product [Symbiodinium sp. CCMP2592]